LHTHSNRNKCLNEIMSKKIQCDFPSNIFYTCTAAMVHAEAAIMTMTELTYVTVVRK